jgi:hypothetical protein
VSHLGVSCRGLSHGCPAWFFWTRRMALIQL